MNATSEVFTIRARKCLRCGRILTSAEAIESGYGCRCMELAGGKPQTGEAPLMEGGAWVPAGQMTFFDNIAGGNK